MCEACDRRLAALSDDELQPAARRVAHFLAECFTQVEPSTDGIVFLFACGLALQNAAGGFVSASPQDHITPPMERAATRMAQAAVELFLGPDMKESSLIITPG